MPKTIPTHNDFSILPGIPDFQLRQYPQEDALARINGDRFDRYSTQKLVDQINRVSCGLLSLGVQAGDKVAVVSENRPEWNFVDLGVQQIGGVVVPVYTRVSRQDYAYICKDAGVKLAFVSTAEINEKLQPVAGEIESLTNVYSFDRIEGVDHWTDLLNEAAYQDHLQEMERRKSQIGEEDLATIVYTSGTTGPPKGVMLTHRNIVSNVKACLPIMPVDRRHRALSFLPLNHVFERMLNYLYMATGVSIYYAESIDRISDNLRLVRPHVFATVPRLLEKTYEKIEDKGSSLSGPGRWIFFWALRLAHDYTLEGKGLFYRWQRSLADRLVFRKWRAALGGRVNAVISGGAALNPRLARVFTAAGIPILEGYGLTETSPVIAVNRMEKEHRRFGTVGRVIEGVEVKIAEDGEILCKGPNIMKGYYQKPDKTREVFDGDWFRTGDIGRMEEGFLSIEDRKKSIFKTSGGKYVAPTKVENTYGQSPFIEHILVMGENRRMVTALILPNFERLRSWCKDQDISWKGRKEMIEKEMVKRKFAAIIDDYQGELSHSEQVKKFELVADDWSVDSGELTPTMKLKRPVLTEKYAERIEQLYEE